MQWLTVRPGQTVVVRLLPGWVSVRYHRLNDANYLCGKTLQNNQWKGLCPACDAYGASWVGGVGDKTLKPFERFFWNVISRPDNDGPLVYGAGRTVQTVICENILGSGGETVLGQPKPPVKALGDVTHLLRGRDMTISSKVVHAGNMQYPQYSVSFGRPKRAGSDAEIERWLAQAYDLQQFRKPNPNLDLKAALEEYLAPLRPPPKRVSHYRSIDDQWE